MLNTIYLIISIILGVLNIYQFFENKAKKKILENILATSHNVLEGISYSINQIVSNSQKFSQKDDIINSLGVLGAFVHSMARAIEEQRFYRSSEEVKRAREKSNEKFKKWLEKIGKKRNKDLTQINQ